ncbi:hypothetical protein RJD24_14785 [Bacillaceae bacterium IKA-2]|nr:hypothetical protein RJD24_14785 [Bacillaceae bacterium IKA-2]
MSKEIQELTIELELADDLAYELHYDEDEVKIFKKTTEGEEEVDNDGKVINSNLVSELSISSDMTSAEISEKILKVLGNNSFIELDVEVVFADGTEVEFKIEEKEEEE